MTDPLHLIYGTVPDSVVDVPPDAVQVSPRGPGADRIEDVPDGSAASAIVHAPDAKFERQHVLAHALRCLATGAPLIAFAHNNKGGRQIDKELAAFNCETTTDHRRHHRIVATVAPQSPTGIDHAIIGGDPRWLDDIGLWSQPGLFNWDKIDPGSQLLLDHLPELSGRGVDLGCGIGVLARAVLNNPACEHVTLIDIDRRAVALAERNVGTDRTTGIWADLRDLKAAPKAVDFVVTNPPWHDGSAQDQALGRLFLKRSAELLRPGGTLWLTANRHLAYEATLRQHFDPVKLVAQRGGFKVYCAVKPAAGQSRRSSHRS